MHTIAKQSDQNWYVRRLEIGADGATQHVEMFHGLSLASALRVVNVLNGGSSVLGNSDCNVLERCWG